MGNDKEFDSLISALYETAMEPALWAEALRLYVKFVGANGAHVLNIDNRTGFVQEDYVGGLRIDPADYTRWVTQFMRRDLRITGKMMANISLHEWRCCHHYLATNAVARDEVYQDCLIPIGVRYTMGSLMDQTEDSKVLLGFFRDPSQSPFGAEAQKRANYIAPHFTRAYRLHTQLRQLRLNTELGAAAINALGSVLFIVDSDARILHANHSAEQWLASRDCVLTCRYGKLACSEPDTASKLSAAIAVATGSPAVASFIYLPGPSFRQIWVTPLKASLELIADWQQSLALVLIKDPNRSALQVWQTDSHTAAAEQKPLATRLADSANRFAIVHRLTQRETEILYNLAQCISAREISERNQVSYHTVRSQIASLLQKTGCKRQADLIRLYLRGQ